MDAHAMQVGVPARHLHFAMQQAAALEAVFRDVLVVPAHDRITAQDGVAMMAGVVDRVAAVGEIGPHGIGDEFVLRLGGPVGEAPRRACVAAQSQYEVSADSVWTDFAYGRNAVYD